MANSLLDRDLSVVSLGISDLDRGIESVGAPLLRLNWQPVGDASPDLAWSLAQVTPDDQDADCLGSVIDRANAEAVGRVIGAEPVWTDVAMHASDVWPDMGRRLLHAGPPIPWREMCGPMRGAIIGAILYERWAATPTEAEKLVASGGVDLAPCHEYGAVGPMCWIISPSMPLGKHRLRADDGKRRAKDAALRRLWT